MGRLRSRFTFVCKLALWCFLAFGLPLRPVYAQFIGTVGQASTVSSFVVSPTLVQVIIPTCTVSTPTNCIKMLGQVSSLVTFIYNSGTPCNILLDGSQDGTTWVTLGSSYALAGTAFAPTIVANGYYPVLRLKVNPGGAFDCGLLHGTYSGFQTPLPINNVVQQFTSALVASPVAPAITGNALPYLVSGFQCLNPNASLAYLQLFDAASTPTLGTGFTYQIGIPGGQSFVYPPGQAFLGTKIFFAGAAIAAGGSTAVSVGLNCDFQINYSGPFLPQTPPSP